MRKKPRSRPSADADALMFVFGVIFFVPIVIIAIIGAIVEIIKDR